MTRSGWEPEDDVRELLRWMAEEMPVSPAVPPGLVGRVWGRTLRTFLAVSVSLAALALGGASGAAAFGQGLVAAPSGPCQGSFRWTPIAPALAEGAELRSVAVVSPSDVWAVGDRRERSPSDRLAPRALVLHWDGRTWSRFPAPAPGPASSLESVSASGPNDVWAIGRVGRGPSSRPDLGVAGGRRLVLHWDGSRWRAVVAAPRALAPAPVPAPPPRGVVLADVTAAPTGDTWAVGSRPGAGTPVVLRGSGARWRAVPLRALAGTGRSDSLLGVAAFPDGSFVAVGVARDVAGGAVRTVAVAGIGAAGACAP